MAAAVAHTAARLGAAVLCLAASSASAADAVGSTGDPLAGLISLDAASLAAATGGFRLGNLEIGMGAVVRTTIAGGTAAVGDNAFVSTDVYALEPGMPAGTFRLDVAGTAITGLGLAAIIENTHPDRAISRQVTLNVEIAGLASSVRAAAAARAVAAVGPSPRFR